VKPNANVTALVGTNLQEVNKLMQEDILVLWGGTNDISKNNFMKGLIHEINYLRNNQHTNNIIIKALQRFDLDWNSCVNKEVRKFSKCGKKSTESNSSECRDG
jgi:hypothetical protein